MSTNKTQNYALHSWSPEDDFLRQEFNENFAAIDNALGEKKTVIFGTYVGNGAAAGQTIHLGVPVSVLLIEDAQGTRSGFFSAPKYGGLIFAGVATPLYCELGEDSFRVWQVDKDSGRGYLNQKDQRYFYLAWLA